MSARCGCGSRIHSLVPCRKKCETRFSYSFKPVTRQQLEHIIRAAAGTADVGEIVVIDSQAILGSYPDAPPELTESMEADVFPKDQPQRADRHRSGDR